MSVRAELRVEHAVDQAQSERGCLDRDDAHAAAAEEIAAEEAYYAATPLARRLYTCMSCGHETLTVGYELPAGSRCFMPVRVPGGNGVRQSFRRCGGELAGTLLPPPPGPGGTFRRVWAPFGHGIFWMGTGQRGRRS